MGVETLVCRWGRPGDCTGLYGRIKLHRTMPYGCAATAKGTAYVSPSRPSCE